jgi:LAO/AO transport system ATPase
MSQENHARILLAKIGLDGHDRGVKVLARTFREAGFEVIYTGLWQTCESTMYAAMQEDVDLVGVSLLSAAHMTIMPEIIKNRTKLGVEDIPVVLGGIVPKEDHQAMLDLGVAAVFNPGSSLRDILARVGELTERDRSTSLSDMVAGYESGKDVALARMITRIQNGQSLGDWTPPSGHASIIGITGSPGVGKSSFIGKLSTDLRSRGLRVAVVAVDPTSPITGGALLGDRLRMMAAEPDEGLFIRSLASGDVLGGLGPNCEQIVKLLDGFGFDVIFVETVGAGQADVTIRNLVEHVFLLVMPESGDSVQFSKAGIMEIATHFVLNKCDLDGADRTEAQLLSAVGDDRKVWRVSTVSGEGVSELGDWVASSRGK